MFAGDAGTSDALDYFTDSLAKFTKFSGFRCLATLSYASDIYSSSSIVSRSAEVFFLQYCFLTFCTLFFLCYDLIERINCIKAYCAV